MTATTEHDRPLCSRRRRPSALCCVVLALAALMALPTLTALPGCGGCRQNSAKAKAKAQAKAKKEAEEKKKKEELARRKKKRRKPDFDPIAPASQPMAGKGSGTWYKPSHWTSTTIAAKTNHFDFPGELQLEVTDGKGRPMPMPSTRFTMGTVRDAPLHKGKQKHFESLVFTPSYGQPLRMAGRLSSRKGGRTYRFPSVLMRMPSYQYHLVVLSRQPNYSYLNKLASVKPPANSFGMGGPVNSYYRVVPITVGPQVKSRIELPSYAMLWTGIACVLWDEAEPSKLNLMQQQAMLDWLHWGGQLILSGPGTLGTLRGSFLEDCLPATEATTRELAAVDLDPLLQWSRGSGKEPPELKLRRSVPAIQFKLHDDARYLPGSGDLIAERRVGRGRVVVTAFRLSDLQLTAWKGFDELVNAFLLRRPAREFLNPARGSDQDLHVKWKDGQYSRADHLDAGLISNVRYFTRDSGVSRSQYGADMLPQEDSYESYDFNLSTPSGPGVAAWNDFNGVARGVRETLRKAARIEIPGRRFVFWVVVGYLAVLVPVNWIVFRLLGRVEWCWVAAPVIAVVCTIGVIRAAQLDIGFVRARTEIAVLEMQAGYDRAHVTRYTTLYTSLAAPYNFQFDDPGSLALPFSMDEKPTEHAEHRKLTYRRGRVSGSNNGASLSGYYVESNAIGMVHSEQMIELGGSLIARQTGDGGFEVVNRTQYTLLDARVIRKDDKGNVETLWFGAIEPNQRKRPGAKPSTTGLKSATLDLTTLAGQAQDPKKLEPGDSRLIACLKEELPGLTIDPPANQPRYATMVVAHLNYSPGPDPAPDANLQKQRPRRKVPDFGGPPIE